MEDSSKVTEPAAYESLKFTEKNKINLELGCFLCCTQKLPIVLGFMYIAFPQGICPLCAPETAAAIDPRIPPDAAAAPAAADAAAAEQAVATLEAALVAACSAIA